MLCPVLRWVLCAVLVLRGVGLCSVGIDMRIASRVVVVCVFLESVR